MKLAVAGAGFVGLVTALCLAKHGHEVSLLDRDTRKIRLLQQGEPPFFEAEVADMLAQYAPSMTFTDDPAAAYADALAVFLCVGTPERGDGRANLSYVWQAAEQVAAACPGGCTVVVKSTVPIGTCDRLEEHLARITGADRFPVASNPEFLAQGTAVRDMLYGPRIVAGVGDEGCRTLLSELYAPFQPPLVITDRRTAEMIKYACNNFLALKISYINEIANLCEMVGADVDTVALGMGLDPRIGQRFLRAGIGYGGSCFPKDTKALHWLAKYHDYELKTVKAAIEVNENQKLRLLKKARRYYPCLEGVETAVLGLTFKPGTDDLREAPSLQIVPLLLEDGARLRLWDPVGQARFQEVVPPGTAVQYCDSLQEALSGAQLCLILTEWDEILRLDPGEYVRLMEQPVVLDGRNCYDPGQARRAGVCYDSIGRPDALQNRHKEVLNPLPAAAR